MPNEGEKAQDEPPADLLIVGGGVNGCGIARDAAGRGLPVTLCEMGDLAQATSSASTKLFHGGLRYLERYEFRLVREALIEREVLLQAMPHISWPLRFVLPHHPGLRPRWLLRLGLFLYDHLGGRKLLPPTRTLDLARDPAGGPLKDDYRTGFEYSDCWVEDSRLVILNARDAAERGATILTRTRLVSAERRSTFWEAVLENTRTGRRRTVRARALVNAAGPWVDKVIGNCLRENAHGHVRLVRGSHIVTRRLFEHDRSYIFQNTDGRIVFAIPYETDFTLIGTTDRDHQGDPGTAFCTDEEADYLCQTVSSYFDRPVKRGDIVWRFSGVRPLYDEGTASAAAATRDYVLEIEDQEGALPALHVFGGKITTYRKLAEAALVKLKPYFPQMRPAWTSGTPMPGGDFPLGETAERISALRAAYPFLGEHWAERLWRAYGTDAPAVLGDARNAADLGPTYGWNLTEREVCWLIRREWAETAEDVLWRRSKLGLRFAPHQTATLDIAMKEIRQGLACPPNAPYGAE
ncbi:MAG TPA: glycerol-3-phosphate dehydrogenase [Pseudohaliea sp.]|nr:glycerol-3-phosphate dehydrogenase [Pseudohaliea sp.]